MAWQQIQPLGTRNLFDSQGALSMSVLPARRTLISEKETVATAIAPSIDGGATLARHIITEQQVVFGTAAAAGPRPTRWWTAAARAVGLAKQQVFLAYPPRMDFLDSSRTEREMYRL
jgi:hypothetical protein